jgi:hypothetical protein
MSSMLDLTKNRYSAQWIANNSLDSKLLASAPSIEALKKSIAKFWYQKPEDIEIVGEDVLVKGKKKDGVAVRSKGGRYRFEML